MKRFLPRPFGSFLLRILKSILALLRIQWLSAACERKRATREKEAPHLRTGRIGEAQAENFLKKAGLKIIARNVQVGYDELDLVARQGDALIFVEVKTRASEEFGRPASAVNRAKRKKLSRAAMHFLKKHKLRPPYIRFDVVEVIGDKPEIRHIQNAFTLEGGYRIWW